MHSSHVNGIITGFKGLSKNDVMKGGGRLQFTWKILPLGLGIDVGEDLKIL